MKDKSQLSFPFTARSGSPIDPRPDRSTSSLIYKMTIVIIKTPIPRTRTEILAEKMNRKKLDKIGACQCAQSRVRNLWNSPHIFGRVLCIREKGTEPRVGRVCAWRAGMRVALSAWCSKNRKGSSTYFLQELAETPLGFLFPLPCTSGEGKIRGCQW